MYFVCGYEYVYLHMYFSLRHIHIILNVVSVCVPVHRSGFWNVINNELTIITPEWWCAELR